MVRAVCSSPMLFRTRLWEALFRFLVLVVLAPLGAIQHPQPQQVELRAAVHTAFEEFESIHVPF